MKFLTSSAVCAMAISGSLAAMSLKIARGPSPPTVSRKELQGRSTITEALGNNFTGQSYIAQVTIGTPGQDISLAIDTGSSDTWVLSTTADLCTNADLQAQEESGCETPFNSKASSSLKVVAPGAFNIVYGDSSGASGDYITDDLTIGGTTVKTLEMGLASQANLSQGLLGIGYATNEASEDSSEAKPFIYPNLITEMVSQSLISAPAYSLYLDDLEASSGSIIFGGMDTDKFIGSLVEIPIVPATLRNGSTLYYEFTVAMTSFSVGSTSLSTTAPVPVLLDSGTSLVYLPTRVTRGLYELLGAYDDTEGTGFVYADCNLLVTNSTGAFDFGFGSNSTSNAAGVTIKVPYSEMLFTQQELGIDLTNYLPPDIPFADVCILGIMAQESQPYILGDTFLRSAYVVYDLKNNVVALAQTNFNSTDSNVVEFTADETAIPKVSGVASQASVTATVTGPVGIGATKSATTTGKGSTSTGSSTSGTSTASSSKSAGVTTVPALDMSLLAVLGGSLALSVLGGGLFLL